MQELLAGLSIAAFFMIAILLLVKYLNGGFSYTDTVDSERRYERTRTNEFGFGGGVDYVRRIVIKRQYGNGKIKFITKEVKA